MNPPLLTLLISSMIHGTATTAAIEHQYGGKMRIKRRFMKPAADSFRRIALRDDAIRQYPEITKNAGTPNSPYLQNAANHGAHAARDALGPTWYVNTHSAANPRSTSSVA